MRNLLQSQRFVFVSIVLLLLLVRSVCFDWYRVPTPSMLPTILQGDYIFVNRMAYDLKVPFTTLWLANWGQPQRNDIIVFKNPEGDDRLVKRVVAVPGDQLRFTGGQLWINGQAADYRQVEQGDTNLDGELLIESILGKQHLIQLSGQNVTRNLQLTVPADRFVVLGDNRHNSRDSRFFGAVARRDILGQATATVISKTPDSWQFRWQRFFQPLDQTLPQTQE